MIHALNITRLFLIISLLMLLFMPLSLGTMQNTHLHAAQRHPRIYLNPSKIEFLKSQLQTYPYKTFWNAVEKNANKAIKTDPPLNINTDEYDMMKSLAKPLPDMALAYLLTGKEKYLQGSIKWMDALSSYPNWADNEDVEAAEVLFGMSVAYDWLYDSLIPIQRENYRKKINLHANILHTILVNQKKWWAKDLLQNHNYTNVMAIALAGFALSAEEPQAQEWIKAAQENFQLVLEVLPPDGASHEGVGYWSGGMNALLRYFMAEQSISNIRKIPHHPYFFNAPYFRLYTALPDYNDVADYSDSPRFDYQGPGFILRALASAFKDGRAQWLAEQVEQARGIDAEYSWKDLAWYDANISPVVPEDLPPYAFFDNLGLFLGRSSWSKDAFWFLFKAGPPQGRLAESKGIYTGSHIHPDQGQFALWDKGKWLVVDDGYVFKKRTENHNVLTFNGFGQLGEGKKWFDEQEVKKFNGTASVVYQELQAEYQYLVADLTPIYKQAANLKRWQRTFVALQGKHIVIKDEVTLHHEGEMEGYVHFTEDPHPTSANTFCLNSEGSVAMHYLFPQGGDLKLSRYSIPKNERKKHGNYEGAVAQLTTSIKDSYTYYMVFSSSENGSCEEHTTLKLLRNENALKIKDGKRTFIIDFQRQSVAMDEQH